MLDRKLLRFLRTRGHSPELERAALLYARAGENGLLWHGLGGAGALLQRRRRPVYLRAMRVTLFTLMALTRPYLGVHYPSDVVAGALFGRAIDRLL